MSKLKIETHFLNGLACLFSVASTHKNNHKMIYGCLLQITQETISISQETATLKSQYLNALWPIIFWNSVLQVKHQLPDMATQHVLLKHTSWYTEEETKMHTQVSKILVWTTCISMTLIITIGSLLQCTMMSHQADGAT